MKAAFPFVLYGGILAALYFATRTKTGTASAPSAQLALDPGMDSTTAAEVAAALKTTTDPITLDNLADQMAAAGYGNSATALRAKASANSVDPNAWLKSGGPLPGFSS